MAEKALTAAVQRLDSFRQTIEGARKQYGWTRIYSPHPRFVDQRSGAAARTPARDKTMEVEIPQNLACPAAGRRSACAVGSSAVKLDCLPDWDWPDVCTHLKCTKCGSVGKVARATTWVLIALRNQVQLSQQRIEP
jgi:hypothetical protein